MCNTIAPFARCNNGKDTLETGCCETSPKDSCPSWCQVSHVIKEEHHITGRYADGKKWPIQCICRFCLVTKKGVSQVASMQERLVRAHNFFRCLHDYPPIDNWSFKLELNVKNEHEFCILKHAKTFQNDPVSAENKATAGIMMEFNVALWYIEIRNFDPNTYKSGNGAPIGHYTNVLWKDTKDIGCSFCYARTKNKFNVNKPQLPNEEGKDIFVWTCHYSNNPPNDMLKVRDNLPDLTGEKNAKTMDQCCMMVYPELYDDETKLLPQIHDSPDFMWMNWDRARPDIDERDLDDDVWTDLLELQRQQYDTIPKNQKILRGY